MNVASAITAIQIEGNLLAPDMASLLSTASIKGQQSEDFGLAKTDKLADEIATAWGDAKAYWAAFQRKLGRLQEDDTATTITREWAVSLLESLGYKPNLTRQAEEVDGQTYAISHRAEAGENKPPIHIIGCRLKLDQRPPSGTPRLSAHGLVQEYLNKTEHLWAITTNGYRWRLLRDSTLMTRLSYIEFDLEQILNSENFAEFGLFYRLFHRSRLPEGVDDGDKCLLEFYHQETLQQGGRVRDKLRDGVEEALRIFGNGFIQHPDNQELRQKLGLISHFEPSLTREEYYRQLLRLIYRLLFLMVAEARDLLLIGDDVEKGRIYREYYSIERLRRLAERPSYRREGFQDLWQGLRVAFLLFDENWRGQVLGLSPLNGDLFGSNTLPDIDNCAIDNYDLLKAIKNLSLYVDKNGLRRVNYAALDVEELGSVYESLLDFHPQVRVSQGRYEFLLVYGSERKTTGSFYTPPQLVQQLIKTALEPVIQECLSRSILSQTQTEETFTKTQFSEKNDTQFSPLKPNFKDKEKALLSLKIVDPACGSGHFLLAAARRIGKELARIPTGETEPGKEPLNLAIRDVIQNCIYGVDLNPLAVDLCKVSLWIEGFHSGMPLNFLDHRIKCGNSLVGVLDLDVLKEGIPDEGFKAVTGDNKTLSTQFKKRNKNERENEGQLSIFDCLDTERTEYIENARVLGEIAETTPQQVREKQARYKDSRKNPGWWRDFLACNLWTAAFFMGLTEEAQQANDLSRQVFLKSRDFRLINPNTFNCPIFRTYADAELTKKIYQRVPVLENEKTGSNPWGISFMAMFHMANDSGLFENEPGNNLVPLYEAKMFHQFDHRYSTYDGATQANLNVGILPQATDEMKQNYGFTVQPRYWLPNTEVENRLARRWERKWLIGLRDICRNTNYRTCIGSILPLVATSGMNLIFLQFHNPLLVTCFYSNTQTLVFDYVVRQKVGGTHLSQNYLKQLPVLPPESYTQQDIEFIAPRVLELVYTAWDMQPFALDMGYDGEPFIWNPNRRAILRAELDAYYAKLYGLTRDELRYILDPADVYGEDFPSETFRVLKNNEIKQFGEYRTQRLVLSAWDRMFSKR